MPCPDKSRAAGLEQLDGHMLELGLLGARAALGRGQGVDARKPLPLEPMPLRYMLPQCMGR
jgi:hypothetical protein